MRLPKTSSLPPIMPHALPAYERIRTAAKNLFRWHGINVSLEQIANLAQTNLKTVRKYFHNREGVVVDYLRSHEREVDIVWREAEHEHPDDIRGQIRYWLEVEEARAVEEDWRAIDLYRAAASAIPHNHPQIITYIRNLKVKELAKVAEKCEAAGYADPKELAQKLLLLVQGAAAVRLLLGPNGPGAVLCETAELSLAAHEREPAAA